MKKSLVTKKIIIAVLVAVFIGSVATLGAFTLSGSIDWGNLGGLNAANGQAPSAAESEIEVTLKWSGQDFYKYDGLMAYSKYVDDQDGLVQFEYLYAKLPEGYRLADVIDSYNSSGNGMQGEQPSPVMPSEKGVYIVMCMSMSVGAHKINFFDAHDAHNVSETLLAEGVYSSDGVTIYLEDDNFFQMMPVNDEGFDYWPQPIAEFIIGDGPVTLEWAGEDTYPTTAPGSKYIADDNDGHLQYTYVYMKAPDGCDFKESALAGTLDALDTTFGEDGYSFVAPTEPGSYAVMPFVVIFDYEGEIDPSNLSMSERVDDYLHSIGATYSWLLEGYCRDALGNNENFFTKGYYFCVGSNFVIEISDSEGDDYSPMGFFSIVEPSEVTLSWTTEDEFVSDGSTQHSKYMTDDLDGLLTYTYLWAKLLPGKSIDEFCSTEGVLDKLDVFTTLCDAEFGLSDSAPTAPGKYIVILLQVELNSDDDSTSLLQSLSEAHKEIFQSLISGQSYYTNGILIRAEDGCARQVDDLYAAMAEFTIVGNPECEHDWEIKFDSNYHWNVCKNCGWIDESSHEAHDIVSYPLDEYVQTHGLGDGDAQAKNISDIRDHIVLYSYILSVDSSITDEIIAALDELALIDRYDLDGAWAILHNYNYDVCESHDTPLVFLFGYCGYATITRATEVEPTPVTWEWAGEDLYQYDGSTAYAKTVANDLDGRLEYNYIYIKLLDGYHLADFIAMYEAMYLAHSESIPDGYNVVDGSAFTDAPTEKGTYIVLLMSFTIDGGDTIYLANSSSDAHEFTVPLFDNGSFVIDGINIILGSDFLLEVRAYGTEGLDNWPMAMSEFTIGDSECDHEFNGSIHDAVIEVLMQVNGQGVLEYLPFVKVDVDEKIIAKIGQEAFDETGLVSATTFDEYYNYLKDYHFVECSKCRVVILQLHDEHAGGSQNNGPIGDLFKEVYRWNLEAIYSHFTVTMPKMVRVEGGWQILIDKLDEIIAQYGGMEAANMSSEAYTKAINMLNGYHFLECTHACMFAVLEEHTTSGGCADNRDGTHTGTCNVCGSDFTASHIMGEWRDDGKGTRTRDCSQCDYSESMAYVVEVIANGQTTPFDNFVDGWTYAHKQNGEVTVRLLADIEITETAKVTHSALTLDLNGYTLEINTSNTILRIESKAGVILTDTSSAGSGKLKGCDEPTASFGANGVYVLGSFTLLKGTITGFQDEGVDVSNSGTFLMQGGAITECRSSGVKVSGKFTMEGGTISNNYDSYCGAGVYISSSGTFRMSGGSITGNTAKSVGGGIYITGGTFIMTGGTISGNTAEGDSSSSYYGGGGVYLLQGESATMIVSGCPIIKDNIDGKNGRPSNLFLATNKYLTIDGSLDSDAEIHLDFTATNRALTKGYSNVSLDTIEHFYLDVTVQCFYIGDDGELHVGNHVLVNYQQDEGSDTHTGECKQCGERITESCHTTQPSWKSNSDSHWKECDTCGRHLLEEQHTYNELADWIDEQYHGYYCSKCYDYITEEHHVENWNGGGGWHDGECVDCYGGISGECEYPDDDQYVAYDEYGHVKLCSICNLPGMYEDHTFNYVNYGQKLRDLQGEYPTLQELLDHVRETLENCYREYIYELVQDVESAEQLFEILADYHSGECLYCGYEKIESHNRSYDNINFGDSQYHKDLCRDCQSEILEEHGWNEKGESTGPDGHTRIRYCYNCLYEEDLGFEPHAFYRFTDLGTAIRTSFDERSFRNGGKAQVDQLLIALLGEQGFEELMGDAQTYQEYLDILSEYHIAECNYCDYQEIQQHHIIYIPLDEFFQMPEMGTVDDVAELIEIIDSEIFERDMEAIRRLLAELIKLDNDDLEKAFEILSDYHIIICDPNEDFERICQVYIILEGHTFEWKDDNGTHIGTCVCGEEVRHAANFRDEDWTSTGDSEHSRKCVDCDIVETAPHSPEKVDGHDATCTEDGLTDGSRCSVCGEILKEQETISATGHSWGTWEVITRATCEAGGQIYHKCNTCGAEETQETAALGHDLVDVAEKQATCTENGWSAHKACTRCDYTTEHEVYQATGHQMGGWQDEYGMHRNNCSKCDYYEEHVGLYYDYDVEPTGDGHHTRACHADGCTLTLTEDCNYEVEGYNDEVHYLVCLTCWDQKEQEHQWGDWSGWSDYEHYRHCYCGYDQSEQHKFEYKDIASVYDMDNEDLVTDEDRDWFYHKLGWRFDRYLDGLTTYKEYYEALQIYFHLVKCETCGWEGLVEHTVEEWTHNSGTETHSGICLDCEITVTQNCSTTGSELHNEHVHWEQCAYCGEHYNETAHDFHYMDFDQALKSLMQTMSGRYESDEEELYFAKYYLSLMLVSSGDFAYYDYTSDADKAYRKAVWDRCEGVETLDELYTILSEYHIALCGVDNLFDWGYERDGSCWYVLVEKHELSDWTEEDGMHKRSCDCGYVEEHAIEVTEWTHVSGTNTHTGDCDVCGEAVIEDCVFGEWTTVDSKHVRYCDKECGNYEEHEPSWGEGWTSTGNIEHSRTCETCGITETAVHDWSTWEVVERATCEAGGQIYHKCDTCGTEETQETAALGHDLVDVEAKAATCTENGWSAHKACTRCDYTTEHEVYQATDHQMAGWTTVDGMHRNDCSKCDYYEEHSPNWGEGWKSTGDSEHTRTCVTCAITETASHSDLVWNNTDADYHWQYCPDCDYETDHEQHGNWHYEAYETAQHHDKICGDCGYTTQENCYTSEQSWHKDGDNHWHECDVCDSWMDREAHQYNDEFTDGAGRRYCKVCEWEEKDVIVSAVGMENKNFHSIADALDWIRQQEDRASTKYIITINSDRSGLGFTIDSDLDIELNLNGYNVTLTNEGTDPITVAGKLHIYGGGKVLSQDFAGDTLFDVLEGGVLIIDGIEVNRGDHDNTVITVNGGHVSFVNGASTDSVIVFNENGRLDLLTDEVNYWFDTDKYTCEEVEIYINGEHIAHKWSVWAYVEDSNSQHTHTCSVCGDTETVNCEFGAWTQVEDMHGRTCTECGHYEEHAPEISGELTNNDNGTHTGKCAHCDLEVTVSCEFGAWTQVDGMHRHTCECGYYEEHTPEISGELTNNGSGTHTGKCAHCDLEVTVSCEFGDWTTVDGKHRHTCECGYYEEHEADWGEGWKSTGNSEHSRTCETCGLTETAAHSPEEVKGYEETCTSDGLTDGSRCSVCGEILKEQETISATGHSWSTWKIVKEATCTENGQITHQCSKCDVTETQEVLALGHDLVDVAEQAATCTENGWSAHQACTRCDYTTEHEVYEAPGHDFDKVWHHDATGHWHECTVCQAKDEVREHVEKVVSGYDATCTETGLTAGLECEDCGEILKAQETISETGHSWTVSWEWTVNGSTATATVTLTCANDPDHTETKGATITTTHTPATCEADGYYTHNGSVTFDLNGETYTDSREGEGEVALDHNWSDWTAADEVTCIADGTEQRTCDRCNETQTRIVKALGHDWSKEWSTSETEHWHDCSRCEATNDKATHTYTEWTNAGNHQHVGTCECGATLTEDCSSTGAYTDDGAAGHHLTCDKCGEALETVVHNWNDWTYSELEHSRECKDCHYVDSDIHVISDATKVDEYYHHGICDICGYEAKAAHRMGEWTSEQIQRNSLLAETEQTHYSYCSDCTHSEEHTAVWSEWSDHSRHCTVDGCMITDEHTFQAGEWTDIGDTHVSQCTVCGQVESHEESWGDWSNHSRTCNSCNLTDSHDAQYEWTDNGGTHTGICAICEDEVSHPANFKDDDWTVTDNGHIHTCQDCTITETQPHELEEVPELPAQCGVPGYTAHKACKHCEYTEGYEEIPALEHDWSDWTTVKEATCTENGEVTRKCSKCETTETHEVAALGHELVEVEGKDATCTEDGYTAHKACTRCDYKEDYEVISAEGHDWSAWATVKEATCTESGEITRTCSKCNVIETQKLAALGHNIVNVPAQAATCTQSGHTAYKKCTRCNYTEGYSTIPATGHTWGDWTTVKAATCTENGLAQRSCSKCGATQSQTISAKGHDWSDWSTVKEATCTEEGTEQRICSNCEQIETRAIPATGHDWAEDWSHNEHTHWNECNNGCGAKGNEEEHIWDEDGVCTVCGDLTKAKEKAKEKLDKKAEDAKKEIDEMPHLTDEEKEDFQKRIDEERNKGFEDIENSETLEDIVDSEQDAEDRIDDILAEARKKSDDNLEDEKQKAKDEIDKKAEDAKKEIDSRDDLSDKEKEEAKKRVDDEAKKAKDAIDAATSSDQIADELQNGKDAIDDILNSLGGDIIDITLFVILLILQVLLLAGASAYVIYKNKNNNKKRGE